MSRVGRSKLIPCRVMLGPALLAGRGVHGAFGTTGRSRGYTNIVT